MGELLALSYIYPLTWRRLISIFTVRLKSSIQYTEMISLSNTACVCVCVKYL